MRKSLFEKRERYTNRELERNIGEKKGRLRKVRYM